MKNSVKKNLTLREAILYNWNNTSNRATSNELVGHVISRTSYLLDTVLYKLNLTPPSF